MQIGILVLIDAVKTEILLEREIDNYNPNYKQIWVGYPENYYNDNDYLVKIYADNINDEYKIELGVYIETSESDIKGQFVDALIELQKVKIEDELSGIESTNDSNEQVKEVNPYDPELIRVDPKPFPISHIYRLMISEENELDLSPDFQRNFVWNDITRKSRLIESLLLRIPLPVFYLTQDKEGKYQVVDGVQRLTVIKSYMNNEFKLKNLEYLKECEGKYFKHHKYPKESLDPKYVRRINDTFITANVIDPQTPNKVKFDIFKRINTGGKTLNPQEIRNCLASINIRKMLKRLACSEEFINATYGGVSSTRMADQELVLRFIGFYYLRVLRRKDLSYKGDIDSFLDNVLTILNSEEKLNIIQEIELKFLNSMKNAHYLFDKYAFRKCLPEHLEPNAKKQLLNKSLFVTISVYLSLYDNKKIQKDFDRGVLALPFANEIEANGKYLDVLTNGTSDAKRLDYSFEIAKKIINRELQSKNA